MIPTGIVTDDVLLELFSYVATRDLPVGLPPAPLIAHFNHSPRQGRRAPRTWTWLCVNKSCKGHNTWARTMCGFCGEDRAKDAVSVPAYEGKHGSSSGDSKTSGSGTNGLGGDSGIDESKRWTCPTCTMEVYSFHSPASR